MLVEEKATARDRPVNLLESLWIGVRARILYPLPRISRSGATISTGLLLGVAKTKVEEFSFALAVILTPAAIYVEGKSVLLEARKAAGDFHLSLSTFTPSLLGMIFAFLAGLLALKWLSRWLKRPLVSLWHLLPAGRHRRVFVLYCRGY